MSASRRDLSVAEFREYVKTFDDYDHPLVELRAALVAGEPSEVVQAEFDDGITVADTSSSIIVRLSDGRAGYFFERSDSSGHGRQCDAGWIVYPTVEEALAKRGRDR